MKTFAKKFPTFWTGATARQLAGQGPFVKLLADYFFTSPAAVAADNYGIYYVERQVILRHVECHADELAKNIEVLAQLHVAYYDHVTEWVFVREQAAWQYGTPLLPRDFNCSNARRFYKGLPRNPWLGPWFDRYVEDLCLQHDEEANAWVDRREWTGIVPEISRYVEIPAPARPAATRPLSSAKGKPHPQKKAPAKKKADKPFIERVLHRLRSLKMNGLIGTQLNIAIKQVEQGDVELRIVERQLLDVVIQELGQQVEEAAIAEVGEFRGRMPAPEFSSTLARAKDSAARRLINLPAFIES